MEPHQIEAVLFRLTDVVTVAFIVAFARKIGVIVGDDAPDVPSEAERLAVDEDMGIAQSDKFVETEKDFTCFIGLEGVKHRILRGPEFKSRSIKSVAADAVFQSFLFQKNGGEGRSASGKDGAVIQSFRTVAEKQA